MANKCWYTSECEMIDFLRLFEVIIAFVLPFFSSLTFDLLHFSREIPRLNYNKNNQLYQSQRQQIEIYREYESLGLSIKYRIRATVARTTNKAHLYPVSN